MITTMKCLITPDVDVVTVGSGVPLFGAVKDLPPPQPLITDNNAHTNSHDTRDHEFGSLIAECLRALLSENPALVLAAFENFLLRLRPPGVAKKVDQAKRSDLDKN